MKLLRRLLGRCSHRFSWPRSGEDGRDYQVCLICGATFSYDWEQMRQTGLSREPQSQAKT